MVRKTDSGTGILVRRLGSRTGTGLEHLAAGQECRVEHHMRTETQLGTSGCGTVLVIKVRSSASRAGLR
jgi:hypothetical protein